MSVSKLAALVIQVGCVAALVGLLPAGASAVVVPSGLDFVEGNAGNCFPTTGCVDTDRYQQVFDASEFSGPIVITELRFRRNAGTGSFTHNFTSVTVQLSTTSAAPDALSTTFADNQGSDLLTVRSGALTLESVSVGGSPAPFDIVLPLTSPFSYDPSEGNLLLDWTNLGGETFLSVFYDAQDSTDSVSRLFAGPPASATGTADTIGLVVEFVELVGDHPCCDQGTAGCDDVVIQAEVCKDDNFCCRTSWDGICVGEVTTVAGQSCNECVDRDTSSASNAAISACVCAVDSFCCTTRWDDFCVSEVESEGCGSCAEQGFIYVNNNESTTNSVTGFAVESGAGIPTGFLTALRGSPYTTSAASGFSANIGSVAGTADGSCVFATNSTAGTVSAFSRAGGGGLFFFESEAAGTNPTPVTVDDVQGLVFVGNFTSSDISVYSLVGCDLTLVGTYPVAPALTPLDLEVSSDGSKLFVTNTFSSDISVMEIGAGGTSLTHVAGSPFNTGSNVHGLALRLDESDVYTCDEGAGTTSGFDIGAGGFLTPTLGSPYTAGTEPIDGLVSRSNEFLIVSNNSSVDLDVFDIAANGSLASVGTFPTDSPSQGPAGLATNLSGQQVFVVNGGFDFPPSGESATVSAYNLSGAGTLSPIFGSPFDTGVESRPSGIVFIPEPGRMWMLLAGVSALAGLNRRRRSRQARDPA